MSCYTTSKQGSQAKELCQCLCFFVIYTDWIWKDWDIQLAMHLFFLRFLMLLTCFVNEKAVLVFLYYKINAKTERCLFLIGYYATQQTGCSTLCGTVQHFLSLVPLSQILRQCSTFCLAWRQTLNDFNERMLSWFSGRLTDHHCTLSAQCPIWKNAGHHIASVTLLNKIAT